MAHKKAGGSTRLGRDSNPQYLGVKAFGGQKVTAGSIIVRQRGTVFHAGENVKRAGDDSLYAKTDGVVEFQRRKVKNFTGCFKKRIFVRIKQSE